MGEGPEAALSPDPQEKLSLAQPLSIAGFAAVVLGVAAGHARFLLQAPDRMIGIVPDDTFYYLQIARHLVAGHGSTFDGVHPASGYHPGWMALLVPLAALLRDPEGLLRGALVLAFLLHVTTAAVLARLFRRFTSPRLALTGALCWLVNPLALHLSLLGMESALYMLSLALVLGATAGFATRPVSLRSHLGLGAALALCFWARTDAVILALVTCAVAPIFKGFRPPGRPWLRSSFLIGATFTAGILPWFLYCWRETGSPLQNSGVAKLLWAGRHLRALSLPERLARVADFTGRVWLAPPWSGWDELPVNPFVCVAMIPAAVGLLLALRRRPENRPLLAASVWLLGATALTGVIYGLFYWEMPIWYHAQPAFLLFVISYVWIARFGAALAERRWGRGAAASAPAILLAVSLLGAFAFYRDPPVPYPWQADFLGSQGAFEQLVPPGEAIGCFNAGIPAYFSQRRIVNLDGLVNTAVVPYYRRNDLDRYFADSGLHYLADDIRTLGSAEEFMTAPLRLRELACVPLQGLLAQRRCLWKVEGPSSPPAPLLPPPSRRPGEEGSG